MGIYIIPSVTNSAKKAQFVTEGVVTAALSLLDVLVFNTRKMLAKI